MLIKELENPTRRLGQPEDWDELTQGKFPCDTLPIWDVTINDQPAMLSAWQPLPEELEALNKGAAVLLWVLGTRHPVVSVGVENLNADAESGTLDAVAKD